MAAKLPSWGEIEAGAQRIHTSSKCRRCDSCLEGGECPIHGQVAKHRGGELCTVCKRFVRPVVCPNPECRMSYDGHYHKLVLGIVQTGGSTSPCPKCKLIPAAARAMRDFVRNL